MADTDEPTELSTDRARGGTTLGMTRYVLAISLLLVIGAFAFILWS